MQYNDEPVRQSFKISGVRHILPEDAYQEFNEGNAVIVDVRETAEASFEYIPLPEVYNYPVSTILDLLTNIPSVKPIFVISDHGERSSKVVNLFMRNGLPDSYNIDGGLTAWKAAGLPVEDILPEACSHCTVAEPACSCCTTK